MKAKFTVSLDENAGHNLDIVVQGGTEAYKIHPGETQDIELTCGHVAAINVGDALPGTKDEEVELSDEVKEQANELMSLYPDHTIGAGSDDGSFSIVDSTGAEIDRGSFDELKERAPQPIEQPPAKDGTLQTGIETVPEEMEPEIKAKIQNLHNSYPNTFITTGENGTFIVKNDKGEIIAQDTFEALGAKAESILNGDGEVPVLEEQTSAPDAPADEAAPETAPEGEEAPTDAPVPETAPEGTTFLVREDEDSEEIDGLSEDGRALITLGLEAAKEGQDTPEIKLNDGPWLALGSAEADAVLWGLYNHDKE